MGSGTQEERKHTVFALASVSVALPGTRAADRATARGAALAPYGVARCRVARVDGAELTERASTRLRQRIVCLVTSMAAVRRDEGRLNGRARQGRFALVHKLRLCCVGCTACRLVLDTALHDPLNTSEQKADRRLGNGEATKANPAKAGDAKPRGYGCSAMRRDRYARRAAG